MKLFAVYLGGEAAGSNQEVHDTVFVVGDDIKQCFNLIKSKWFGKTEGLHIDSWAELSEIKGYKIQVSQEKKTNKEKLFFVNLGFSYSEAFGEQHFITFIANTSKQNAKDEAKKLFPNNSVGHHIDNLMDLSQVDGWNINLIKDESAKQFKFENVYWKISN